MYDKNIEINSKYHHTFSIKLQFKRKQSKRLAHIARNKTMTKLTTEYLKDANRKNLMFFSFSPKIHPKIRYIIPKIEKNDTKI